MPLYTHWFFALFASLYLLQLVWEITLDRLNLKEMARHPQVPALFSDKFSQADYMKTQAYTRAKTYFGWGKGVFDALLLWTLILSGAFGWLQVQLGLLLPSHPFWAQVFYPFCILIFFYVTSLPFTLYFQFGLEERFGFNKMTAKTFIVDQIKSALLAVFLGIPLLVLLLKVVDWLGAYWWLGAWGVMMGVQFLMAALFPVLLAPIFYKFTPLADGELKERILALAQQVKFKMAGIYTIDGSKRSAHSNAFFAGMGKARRIVLFDTLMEQLNQEQIVGVLAHEMGHSCKKHIPKSLILSSAMSLLGLWVLSLMMHWPPFFQIFGVETPSVAVGLVLFSVVSSVFTFPLTPLFQMISRHNEYEADEFSAKTVGDTKHLGEALVKLSKDNLSNLTPHPWYSFYHYSHPTTGERIRAMAAREA